MLLHIYLILMVNLTWLQLHPGARKYCPGSGRAVGHFCMLYVSKNCHYVWLRQIYHTIPIMYQNDVVRVTLAWSDTYSRLKGVGVTASGEIFFS